MIDTSFSIKEAIRFGWTEFKKDPWFFVGVTAGLTGFSIVVESLTGDGYGVGALLGFLISLLASTIVTIAYARMALSTVAGAHVGWNGLWAPQHFFSSLGSGILQFIIIFIGFILLIVPGIIAGLLLCFTQLAVVDKNLSPVEALKESYRLSRPHLWQLFLFSLSLIVLNLIGLIALVVGLLVTIPVTLIAVASVYKKLSGALEPMVVVVPNEATTPQ